MTSLEKKYRAAVRWYPRRWRRANGDALVGTLLDRAEAEGRAHPNHSELRNIRVIGLGKRLAAIAAWMFVGIALLAALFVLRMTGVGLSTTMILTPPSNGSYVVYAWQVLGAGIAVMLVFGAAAVSLFVRQRRNRRPLA
jgi:hypothetical protein